MNQLAVRAQACFYLSMVVRELTENLRPVHTTRYYSDFPLGRMFSLDDPEFPGRLDLVRTYEKYANIHGLVCH
jgi:hypothetical protein